jgi:hypothetical protein
MGGGKLSERRGDTGTRRRGEKGSEIRSQSFLWKRLSAAILRFLRFERFNDLTNQPIDV